jgi:hypothetical protein
MTFINRTNSSALQKKSRAVQEYLHVQKFQSKLDENHFVSHCTNYFNFCRSKGLSVIFVGQKAVDQRAVGQTACR